jgi:transposase
LSGKENPTVPSVADVVDAVVGVDTHRDTHDAEIATPTGIPIATLQVPNTSEGFAALLAWAAARSPGPRTLFAVEGTRSYGIGLARAVAATGQLVVEIERPTRTGRRRRGKSDPIDAHLAVLTAVRLDAGRLPLPRADGDREALRILLGARADLVATATAQTNRLRALLLGGNDTDRQTARGVLTDARLAALARRRPRRDATREHTIRQAEIRRLAMALRESGRQLKTNRGQLRDLVTDLAPTLLDRHGIGPVSAAQAIVSYSHPGRLRNDAAFASLAGVCPIPASSGRTVRHRLNRGGDRALNRAIHTIAVVRMRSCPRTRAYITRRREEGKTDREIRRALKRYIARELYRHLAGATTP